MSEVNFSLSQKIKEVSQKLEAKVPTLKSDPPQIGVILGSGLGAIADDIQNPVMIPYREIPHFYSNPVEGHAGEMIIGRVNNVSTVFLKGRFHLYEGYSMDEVIFPTRLICSLGIHTLILTNAAGGINGQFRAGDIMLIQDHLNLTGNNPLKGPSGLEFGARFLDMSEAYPKSCIEVFKSVATKNGISLQEGIYASVLGPTYETPAEVRMLRTLGADAVGMSTIPETIAANQMGVKVAGISCITNLASGLSAHKLSHQEVLATSKNATQKLKSLIQQAIPLL